VFDFFSVMLVVTLFVWIKVKKKKKKKASRSGDPEGNLTILLWRLRKGRTWAIGQQGDAQYTIAFRVLISLFSVRLSLPALFVQGFKLRVLWEKSIIFVQTAVGPKW
jgi:hypothetical protein